MRILCDTLDHAAGQRIARSTTSTAISSPSPSARAALDHALAAAASRGASVRAVWVRQRPLLGFLDEQAASSRVTGSCTKRPLRVPPRTSTCR
ncbi:hypothetical protein OH786_04120 [Streptomyces atratus]|uniref:hypothetical protein n=1 Tax=Streptomyces atratus TaxID=1893 RepID=UPI0011613210|nr:hypothetical protein [Streptomyces atratus]